MLRKKCKKEYIQERWGEGHRSFHSTARSYIDHYGRKSWDNAYTFAVVRHPLARQVSNFFFLAETSFKKGGGGKNNKVQDVQISLLPDEVKIQAFHEWISELYLAYPPGSPDHYLFGSKGVGNEEFESFNSTQTSWMTDEMIISS